MSQSRHDKIRESYFADTDAPDEYINKLVSGMIERENQSLWALYRHLDVSQSHLLDMVNMAVEPSQSTVSRLIRQHDKRVLHDEQAVDIHQLHEDDVEHYPDPWLDAYRDTLAELITRLEALARLSSHDRRTPKWAAEYYPELVGCHRVVAESIGDEKNIQIGKNDHLTDMESVNIERWE